MKTLYYFLISFFEENKIHILNDVIEIDNYQINMFKYLKHDIKYDKLEWNEYVTLLKKEMKTNYITFVRDYDNSILGYISFFNNYKEIKMKHFDNWLKLSIEIQKQYIL